MDERSLHRQKGLKELKSCGQEVRLVLFGHGWLEKSLAGNAILQQQMFDTRRDVKMCVRRQAFNQNGQKMIVVNTPDRWVHYNVHEPGLINDNISEGLSMSQPGPHAFLLVVPIGPNRGKEWTVEGPLTLLNDHVWKNTIVLFTKPEKLKGMSVEDYVAKVKFLGPLMEKCGGRYHLLDTSFYGHERQVEELMEKIDAMVEGNKTEIEAGISIEVEAFLTNQNREEMERKAKQRQSDVATWRSVLRSLTKMHEPASEPHILIIGPKHAGKSSTGNTILCSEDFSTSLQTSQSRAGRVHEKKVTVVDTPGWHGRYFSLDTPFEVKQQIVQSSKDAEPDAVLLVLRCDETFTETDLLKVQEHMGLLGASVWSKTIVLFTYKDKLGRTAIEEHMERWPALQWIVDKCRNRYHVLNNLDKNDQSQVKDLLEKIEELEVLNDMPFLLQRYMEVQERYQNLDESYKKTQIQLNRKMREIQEMGKLMEEKDRLANNLMKTIAQNEEIICSRTNIVDEMKRKLNVTHWRLENAEKDNDRLKACLLENDRMIRRASEKTAERERFHQKMKETIEMQDQMATEVMKLQEEKKQLKTESECTKMMLQSLVEEVQKHFKKKHSLQRKMAADASTLDTLFTLEKEEEEQKSKHSEQNLQPSEAEKQDKPLSRLSSSVWLLAGGAALGAALGAAFGGSRTEGGLRLNLSSAAGAAAGTLLGACWKSSGSDRQVLGGPERRTQGKCDAAEWN